MPNTYTELLKTTVGTATGTVTLNLSGISGYTDLVLQCSLRTDTSTYNNMNYPLLRFNGDSTSGLYSTTNLYARNTGSGDGAYSTRSSSQNEINLGGVATSAMASGIFSTYQIQLQNYANTSVFKTVLGRIGTGGNLTALDGVWASVGLWRNTNAITSISLTASSSGLFQVGSTFSLYGIANADQGAAKATGGIITEDSQYWYHTFAASGAFIPKQSLSCDVLVVAGGGSGTGGAYSGGGGGAGGLLYYPSQSLTATSYSITVGAGGAAPAVSTTGVNGNNSSFTGLTAATGGGGGGGGSAGANNGRAGGSGGGAASTDSSYGPLVSGGAASPSGQGNAGGSNGSFNGSPFPAGGGGGAGGAGQNAQSVTVAGNGGVGTSAYSSWVLATGVGQVVSGTGYFAGGGGGGVYSTGYTGGVGGFGGGGNSSNTASAGFAGVANTGGGGGGGPVSQVGGNGGSGVVIVRYAK